MPSPHFRTEIEMMKNDSLYLMQQGRENKIKRLNRAIKRSWHYKDGKKKAAKLAVTVGLTTLFVAVGVATHGAAVPVVAAIDARHAHVYLQVFSPGGRTFTAPRLAPLHEAARAAAQTPSCLVGDAAQLVAAALLRSDPAPATVDAQPAPDIAWVARMGAVVSPDQAPLKPHYLRAPDAQPQNAAQLPRR